MYRGFSGGACGGAYDDPDLWDDDKLEELNDWRNENLQREQREQLARDEQERGREEDERRYAEWLTRLTRPQRMVYRVAVESLRWGACVLIALAGWWLIFG